MAKLLSPADRPVFTPPDQVGRGDAAVAYTFLVPASADEARLGHAVRKAGGRTWGLGQILAAMADGVRAVIPDEADPERVSVLAEIAGLHDAIVSASREVQAVGAAGVDLETQADAFVALGAAMGSPRIEELRAILEPQYPRLASMLADNQVYGLIRGTEAARLFLVGWAGIAAPLRRGVHGLDEASLRRIPAEHRIGIGGFVDTLLAPTEDEEKNFASPSGGGNAGTASTAASTTVPATPSKETPGSPTSSASS